VLGVLGVRPLWADELLQLGGAREGTWGALVRWAQVLPGGVPLPLALQKLSILAFGWSNWAVRLPAALFGIGAAVLFWKVARGRLAALAMFVAMPMLFRYSTEGRMYSEALFFVLLCWLARRRWLQVGAAVLAVYSSPFALFPLLAISPVAAVIAGGALLPWWLVQRGVQAAAGSTAVYQFAWGQLHPLLLLREFTGGGYWCGVSLLLLAAIGRRIRYGRMLGLSLVGPVVADAVAGYFFAVRQWLFALPALVLLAAEGVRSRWGFFMLSVFLVGALAKDVRMTFFAAEDWGLAARALRVEVSRGACLVVAPAAQLAYYTFYEPSLAARGCGGGPAVLAVSPYTTAAEERAALGGAAVTKRVTVGTIRLLSFQKVQ
jgi:hypothetical protein